MRIKFLILALAALSFTACNSQSQTSEVKSVNVAQLLSIIDQNIDQEIYITGTVNHVCSHSGRRCFLIDSTGEYSIKIEAAGEIESFGKDLIGIELKIKGIVKEARLTKTEIDEWEVETLKKHSEKSEDTGEICSAEMSNIKSMRTWMKEHGKDYYAIYYVEGLQYEMVK